MSVFQLIVASPGVKVTAGLARSVIAESEHKFGSREYFVRFQFIIRCIRVDGRDYAQVTNVVYFECKLEVTGPADRTQHHAALCFLCRLSESQFEERMCMHGGTAAQLGVDYFLSEL